MAEYVGLDVSMKETAVSVRRDGKRVWRGKCPSDPKMLAELLRRRAPEAACIIFETGPLSIWFYHALSAEGLPRLHSTWRPTKRMPMTPTAWRT